MSKKFIEKLMEHIDNETLNISFYASNVSDAPTYKLGYELGFSDALESIKCHIKSIPDYSKFQRKKNKDTNITLMF